PLGRLLGGSAAGLARQERPVAERAVGREARAEHRDERGDVLVAGPADPAPARVTVPDLREVAVPRPRTAPVGGETRAHGRADLVGAGDDRAPEKALQHRPPALDREAIDSPLQSPHTPAVEQIPRASHTFEKDRSIAP